MSDVMLTLRSEPVIVIFRTHDACNCWSKIGHVKGCDTDSRRGTGKRSGSISIAIDPGNVRGGGRPGSYPPPVISTTWQSDLLVSAASTSPQTTLISSTRLP
jgi:hypothetical protein